MAFEKLVTTSAGRRPRGCACGVVKSGSDFGIKFRISNDVLTELGWTPETNVDVLWGTGKDAGHVMLSEDANGLHTTWPGRATSAYVQTSVVPDNISLKESIASVSIQHKITDKGLVLELPSFLMLSIEEAAE